MIDTQLERMTVAAILAAPERLASVDDLAVVDLGDFHAIAALTAIRNLQARGATVSVDAVRVELLSTGLPGAEHAPEGWPDNWYDALVATDPTPDLPAAATQIQMLAEVRRMAIAEADAELAAAARRRKPTSGPRAVNTEPVRLAEAFLRYSYTLDDDATLVRWARAWWRYDGTRYVEHDDEALDRDLIGFLDIVVAPVAVRIKDESGRVVDTRTDLQRVTSRSKTINEVRKACLHVCPSIGAEAPAWTSPTADDPPAAHLVVVQNGLLDLRDLTLYPPTPRFFSTTAINAPWDPSAPAPTAWLAFLDSLWGSDQEAIRALQQMFGYLLSTDTSQQKLFALIGPPRSGKGTIARVLKALLGDDAVVNPTLQSLERPFGLAPLVGRTVAVIGDARLGGPTDQAQVVERLLSISGEDSLSIDRKNRDPINVRLHCRVILLSNELPRLYDTSGALASRFVILCLSRSFLGSEDTQLERKLLAELPGILRWAIDGLEDLLEAGRFVVPASSKDAFEHLREISSPHSIFFEECCEFEAKAKTDIDEVYARYKTWCEASGRDPENKQLFGRNLHTLYADLKVAQYRSPDGCRRRAYMGLKLVSRVYVGSIE